VGYVESLGGYHNIAVYPDARTIPGVVLFRFGSAVVFFNAAFFQRKALEAALASPGTKWLVVEGGPINAIDVSGAAAITELAAELKSRGTRLAFANIRTPVRAFLERAGALPAIGADAIFPSLELAARALDSGTHNVTKN
jgi:MFS superfamily sulfate permease-like transporter